ncbi:DHH family phosphohydrolase-like protein [Tupanvirus soda lake]|uniref:DHH family phosphohydrolase-like protein n=2 Tax=Tupanvirus TaxID=2094720 RepID=A0A6N1NJB5_9VIRU|nr:DHH family phosphohydrolase-like protein [Tupanvirus soda lake]QKU34984.1 DHH family phosphohydrolase-like protein [Tupanvirus soda lake]
MEKESENLNNLANKVLDKNNVDVVLYHGSCSDGFGSAFVVWLYYKRLYGLERAKSIQYLPCYYQKENQSFTSEFLEKVTGKNILMCDFSYKFDQLMQLISVAKSFVILDHHKTAKADLDRAEFPASLKIFDMNRSGAGITWDYFFSDQPIPKFLAYIQDRDIWTKKYPETSEFVAFFYEQDFDFELWEKYLDDAMVNKAIDTGRSWLEYQKVIINKIIKKTSYVIQEINGQYSVVLYCNSSELRSDIGNMVFKELPIGDFSCVWDYNLYTDQTNYSLRSTNDRYDVSAIASKFGGGGHRNASGVMFSGMVGCLPFNKIEDPGVLQLLLHGTKGNIDFAETENSFVLFKVKEIREEWLKPDYFDLIKRKTQDCNFIVFETPSQSVDLDKKTGDIIPLREYNMFFNEKANCDAVKKLQYMSCMSKDHVLTFTSSKDFTQIFNHDTMEEDDDCNMEEKDGCNLDDNNKREFIKIPEESNQPTCVKFRKHIQAADEWAGFDEIKKKLFAKKIKNTDNSTASDSSNESDSE